DAVEILDRDRQALEWPEVDAGIEGRVRCGSLPAQTIRVPGLVGPERAFETVMIRDHALGNLLRRGLPVTQSVGELAERTFDRIEVGHDFIRSDRRFPQRSFANP